MSSREGQIRSSAATILRVYCSKCMYLVFMPMWALRLLTEKHGLPEWSTAALLLPTKQNENKKKCEWETGFKRWSCSTLHRGIRPSWSVVQKTIYGLQKAFLDPIRPFRVPKAFLVLERNSGCVVQQISRPWNLPFPFFPHLVRRPPDNRNHHVQRPRHLFHLAPPMYRKVRTACSQLHVQRLYHAGKAWCGAAEQPVGHLSGVVSPDPLGLAQSRHVDLILTITHWVTSTETELFFPNHDNQREYGPGVHPSHHHDYVWSLQFNTLKTKKQWQDLYGVTQENSTTFSISSWTCPVSC